MKSSESKVVIYNATANNGYKFVGWSTSSNGDNFESTDNPYNATITNSTPGSTVNKTLYAVFKPVFYFSANAEKIFNNIEKGVPVVVYDNQ